MAKKDSTAYYIIHSFPAEISRTLTAVKTVIGYKAAIVESIRMNDEMMTAGWDRTKGIYGIAAKNGSASFGANTLVIACARAEQVTAA